MFFKVLVLILATSSACAAQAGRQPATSTSPVVDASTPRASICDMRSLASLESAISDARLARSIVLLLTFKADGTVTDVDVAQSSYARNVDRVARQWAHGIKFCPGAAGVALLPLDLRQS